MPEKKTHALISQLSIADLRKIFPHIYGLPEGAEEDIEKHKSKYDGQNVAFNDDTLERPMCISCIPFSNDGSKYAGLFETVAYIGTKRGAHRTVHHQVVGCKVITLKFGKDGDSKERDFYIAIGRIGGKLAIFFLPAGSKTEWPKNTVFLTFTPAS
jgi:hypothetical protein